MRVIASCFICFVLLLNSGCTVWEKETTNRGGYLDYVLDQHWFKADSKRMRALRAFAIQVTLARIASVSAKNDTERQMLAVRIGALTKQFAPVYACALQNNPLNVPGATKDPCFYFDSAMVQYTTGLFDLAMAALPVDDAKNLVNSVAGSALSPIDYVNLLNALVVVGRDALTYGRVVGALYRDTIELEVQLWLATPAIDTRPPPSRVTADDIAALAAIYAQDNDNMPAWIAAIAALRSRGLEPYPDPKFFVELGGLMKYICDLITKDSTASASCKANLPTTMPAPVSVVSPAPAPVHLVTPAPPPPAPKPAPTPIVAHIGTDQERTILKEYQKVGGATANTALTQLMADPAVHDAIVAAQGANPPPPLFIVVDNAEYVGARKQMVAAACQKGLFAQVANDPLLASACN